MRPKTFLRFLTVVLLSSGWLCAWVPDEIPGLHYPRLAQFARIEGVVVVECIIGNDGSVTSTIVKSGHRLLSEAAAKAAKGWHFKRSEDGHDTSTVQLTFEFRLVGSCKSPNHCEESLLLKYPDRAIVTTEMPGIQPSRSSDH